MGRVPFRADRVAGLDWEAIAPAASGPAIASPGVPMLVRAGWLDGGFADTRRQFGAAEHDRLSAGSQDRRLIEFFARYPERNGKPGGPSTLAFGTLGTGAWQAVTSWPPAGAGTRR